LNEDEFHPDLFFQIPSIQDVARKDGSGGEENQKPSQLSMLCVVYHRS